VTYEEVLTFIHVTFAIVFVGGVMARQVVRLQLHTAHDIVSLVAASDAAGRIESLMVIPGNIAVIIVGFLLASETDAPILGFISGDSENWLLVSNTLLVIGLIMVPLFFFPRGRKFALILDEAVKANDITPALRTAINSPGVMAAHYGELVGLIVIVALMVTRPF
jgi:hypothetical protein